MEKIEKIEIKKLVPVAAKISAGKSKLLNVLFNIPFLECKAGIGTKFINILRYNPKINRPLFYHLKVKNLGGKYDFFKDLSGEIYEGEEKIIEANKAINKKFFNDNIINYEDLFYMTEINTEPFIQDKEYLKDHYFCDIPGLSEYQENINNEQENKKKEEKKGIEIEDKDKEFQQIKNEAKEIGLNPEERKKEIKQLNENIVYEIPKEKKVKKKDFKQEDDIYYELVKNDNKNKTYLTEIFTIIKNYIDGAIIILSVDNYRSIDNYQIIAQLHHVIQKQITNFLIILNKMDLSKNPQKDIGECKGMFAKNFPKFKTFNINLNTFIPISVNKLKNELSMNKDFKSLIYCHFYNFMENWNNYKESKRFTGDLSFINHLRNIIIKVQGNKTKKDFENVVNELNKSNNISKINNDIISIVKDLENDFKDRQIFFGFPDFNNNSDDSEGEDEDEDENDINDVNAFSILKYFYKERNSLIPYISEESNNLLNFFKNKKTRSNTISNQKEEQTEKTILNKSIIKLLKNLNKNISESKLDIKKIGGLIESIQTAISFLKIYNVIFIPFIGEIGSGKSTIINGIIGEDVLPTGDNECTKRGIVIRYLNNNENEINIRKAYFREKPLVETTKYFIEPEDEIIGKGIRQVKGILNDLNYHYNEKEEDSFYYIRAKIKLFDDLGLDNSLKKMIYLIDLPGFGTENIFEKNIILKLMSICNCFIFTVKNTVIKEQRARNILKKIFDQTKYQKNIFTSKLLESSLFILNDFENQKTEENEIEKTKKDIIKIVKGFYNEGDKDLNSVNLCFFNAQSYNIYFNNYNYFFDLKNSIQFEFRSYLKKNQDIFKTPESANPNKHKSFCEFLISQLKNKNKALNSKNKKQIFNQEIEKKLNEIFQILNFNMKEILDNSNQISQQIALGQENITNFASFKVSNFEELKSKINSQIQILNKNMQDNIEQKINNVIERLEAFFSNDFKKVKDFRAVEIFTKQVEQIKEKLVMIYKDSQEKYFNIIDEYKKKIKNSLIIKKNNIQRYLEEKKYKEIIKEIDLEIKSNLEHLNNKIEEFLDNVYSGTDEINKQIIESFNNFAGNITYKNYLNFKDYFSIRVGSKGGNLTKEIIEEIKIGALTLEKIHEEKGFKEWIKSLFSKVNYFQNSIDIILNSFIEKMDYILILLIEDLTRFVEKTYHDIDSSYLVSTNIYTNEQIEEINKLKVEYDQNKYKITDIKNKLVNK